MDDKNLIELEDELDAYQGQWFVINCNSGHEDKVKGDLIQRVESTPGLSASIFDIRISKTPSMNKNGKAVEKNKFPGYIFINMKMNDETWFIVRNTPGVTGFIGSSGKGTKPLPLTSEEVASMLNVNKPKKEEKGKTQKKEKVLFTADFKIEDVVIIKSGPFGNNEGQVKDMDYEKGLAVVNIEVFGRLTPAQISFDNIELAYKG